MSDEQINIPYLIDEHRSIFRLSSGTIAKLSPALFGEDDEDLLSVSDDDLFDLDDDDNANDIVRNNHDDKLDDKGPVDCPEANIAAILFEKTNIPVPRLRRVIKWRGDYIIVADYIRGPTLAEVWPTYSLCMKIRVAFILRRYVRHSEDLLLMLLYHLNVRWNATSWT